MYQKNFTLFSILDRKSKWWKIWHESKKIWHYIEFVSVFLHFFPFVYIHINDNMTETFSFAFNFKLKKVFANKIEKNWILQDFWIWKQNWEIFLKRKWLKTISQNQMNHSVELVLTTQIGVFHQFSVIFYQRWSKSLRNLIEKCTFLVTLWSLRKESIKIKILFFLRKLKKYGK